MYSGLLKTNFNVLIGTHMRHIGYVSAIMKTSRRLE